MLGTTDWTGIAAVIAAVFAGLTGLVSAILAARLQRPTAETHAAVSTPPGTSTLGQAVADIKETVNGGSPNANP